MMAGRKFRNCVLVWLVLSVRSSAAMVAIRTARIRIYRRVYQARPNKIHIFSILLHLGIQILFHEEILTVMDLIQQKYIIYS